MEGFPWRCEQVPTWGHPTSRVDPTVEQVHACPVERNNSFRTSLALFFTPFTVFSVFAILIARLCQQQTTPLPRLTCLASSGHPEVFTRAEGFMCAASRILFEWCSSAVSHRVACGRTSTPSPRAQNLERVPYQTIVGVYWLRCVEVRLHEYGSHWLIKDKPTPISIILQITPSQSSLNCFKITQAIWIVGMAHYK